MYPQRRTSPYFPEKCGLRDSARMALGDQSSTGDMSYVRLRRMYWSLGWPPDYSRKNDMLQWLMDEKQKSSTRQLTLRVLTINFDPIHAHLSHHRVLCLSIDCSETVGRELFWQTFTQASYNLAAYPVFTPSLIMGCRKGRSCRCARLTVFWRRLGASESSSQSSDGTIILKGTHLSVPTHTVRRDGAVYGNPGVFNPFQLSQLNDDDCEGAGHRTVATTGLLSLRIWEGCMIQFRSSRTLLATNELKIILAHILMSYDVRFGDRVSWPTSIHWDLNLIANPVVRIMSRNRANN
ncbi:hypothetical protein EDD16DRAFT_1799612 [Pisolithus croceorrhizus]|nr:hypothetical protein EDD16DRAFT_1799612 [Pisolithus croceorrhizus]KAI6135651.1 hypothetical protein EV401DRAFT_2094516 [Pisolithus croceorrhizus]